MKTVKNSNPELTKFISHLPGMIYQFRLRPDGVTSFPFASEAIKTIYGFSPEEVQQDAAVVFSIIHPDDLDLLNKTILQSAQDLTHWEHEFRIRFADGNVRWLYGNSLPERESDGSTLWHGFITDITVRKEIENQLLESENRFKSLFNEHSSMMLLLDADTGSIVDMNQAAIRFYGFSKDEIVGKHISTINILSADEISNIISSVKNKQENHFLFEHRLKDGTIRNVEIYVSPIKVEERMLDFAIVNDVTNRVDAEKKILESEKQFRGLFEQNQFPMLILDAASCEILDANQAALQFYGYDRHEIDGSSISLLDKSISQTEIAGISQLVFSEGLETLLVKHHTKSGDSKTIEAQLSSITFENKPAFLAIIIDRTEREELAVQLKMEQEYSTFLRSELMIERQENERITISNELHENINQILAAAKLMLEMSVHKGVKDMHMEKGLVYLGKAITMINELSQNLTPALSIMSLNDALNELIRKSELYAGISISYDNLYPLINPSIKEKLLIYRVVEELLNDIILKKEAKHISIQLEQQPGGDINLRIYNDAIVLDCNDKNSCLYDLKKRVEFHKGTFDISKVEEGGCEICITLQQSIKNKQLTETLAN